MAGTTLSQQAIDMVTLLANFPPPTGLEAEWEVMVDLVARIKKRPQKPTEEEMAIFEAFRLRYKKVGTVKGTQVEMAHLAKHKDWREALPALETNFERQITERKALHDSGGFVPPWPMLSTYLNQRRWEMVYFDLGNQVKTDLPEKYVQWLRQFESRWCPFSFVVTHALTAAECEEWKTLTGKFAGLDRSMTFEKRTQVFNQMHQDYFGIASSRSMFASVGEYYNHIKKNL